MKVLPQNLLAVLAVIPVYVAGWFLWLAGQWAAIVPPVVRPGNLAAMMLPPLVLPVVYLGWLASRRLRKSGQPRARLIQFGIAAAAGVVVAALYTLFGSSTGRHLTMPAMIAGALMLAVAVVALVVDRDVELSMRILLFTILAVVPAVVAGRLLAMAGALAFYTAMRASHGSAS